MQEHFVGGVTPTRISLLFFYREDETVKWACFLLLVYSLMFSKCLE